MPGDDGQPTEDGFFDLESRLAWRNVWRNPRRTGLTVAATVFAVFLLINMAAMSAGVHGKMIEDGVRIQSGHVQLSGEGYLEERTLERSLRLEPALARAVEETPGVVAMAPRLVAFGLLSKESATKGVGLFGVDPEREPTVSTLPERMVEGRFLPDDTERPIVLGERLAEHLGASLGDELLLFSVAYTLENAYDLFTVCGIMRLPDPQLDRSLAIIELGDAQAFFAYGDRVSEVAILAEQAGDVPTMVASLREAVAAGPDPTVEVHPWNEVMPELEQLIFIDAAGLYLMLAILVVVVGFGILNTILMSVLERKRELGVMLALGLRPRAIFRVVYKESMLLAAVGLVIGMALAVPFALWFQAHPIPLTGDAASATEAFGIEPVVTFLLEWVNIVGSSLTIFVVAALAALYPAIKASRARPVDALRSI
ncbi:MAG: ABC transporter permease [Myxococcota bacterium]|nr:ABC transporter permease [Myxococcota bacterium]